MSDQISKTDEEWQKELTPEQYEICRRKGTEIPFSGKSVNSKENGVYKCVCCGNALFDSDDKFDSGTGWPSFTKSIKEENVKKDEDLSYGMIRTEVMCKKCGAHLGHVFDDGPDHTGERYCINSIALNLDDKKE